MRSLLMLPSIALLVVGLGACGDAGRLGARVLIQAQLPTALSAPPPEGYLRGDGDVDDANNRDEDNDGINNYGHAASAAQGRAITALVKRYYAAGVAGDGAAACALIYPDLAGDPSLGETAEAVFSLAPSVPPLHVQSCARIMSLLFDENHRRLAADLATVVVIMVRVNGSKGLVLLCFRTTPERWIPVRRERDGWKVEALLDKELL